MLLVGMGLIVKYLSESGLSGLADKAFDKTLVYVTRIGAKYHRDGCRYLRSAQLTVCPELSKL